MNEVRHSLHFGNTHGRILEKFYTNYRPILGEVTTEILVKQFCDFEQDNLQPSIVQPAIRL